MFVSQLEKVKTAGNFPLLIAYPTQLNDWLLAPKGAFFLPFCITPCWHLNLLIYKKSAHKGRLGYELKQSITSF